MCSGINPQATPANLSHPTTIIFCGWMDVSQRSRYLNSFYHHYHTLYHNALIVSVFSKVGFFANTSASRRLNLHQAIASAIESDPVQDDKRKILAHVMSNGGALGFADVCQLYKDKTGRALGVKNIFFDSGLGEYTFRSSSYFLSQTFPKGPLWYPTTAIMWVVSVVLGWTMYDPGPRVESSRVRLNDLGYTDVGQKTAVHI